MFNAFQPIGGSGADDDGRHPRPLVETETAWRHSPRVVAHADCRALVVTRWEGNHDGPHHLAADAFARHYTIDILLVETRVECFRDGRQVSTCAGGFGGTQIAAPGERISGWFSRKRRAVHLFVPAQTLAAAYEDAKQRACPVDFRLVDPAYRVDHRLGKLASIIAESCEDSGPFGAMYHDAVTTAILARLLDAHTAQATTDPGGSGLPPRLLRRAIEFIEANLHHPIALQDIAAQTGLSRMYFAAQFRRSTGFSPHAYLLSRRLDKAKEMLAADSLPLLDVAIAVGFQSQSHFTAVFRRLVGSTPGKWRAFAARPGEVADAGAGRYCR
jgi:AraC family transcriptional regulator